MSRYSGQVPGTLSSRQIPAYPLLLLRGTTNVPYVTSVCMVSGITSAHCAGVSGNGRRRPNQARHHITTSLFVGKVESRKLAMKFARNPVVDACCLLGGFVSSNINTQPPFPIRMPGDTLVRRTSVVPLHRSVSHVLAPCANAEIAASVVNPIAVDVVGVHALGCIHQPAVHEQVIPAVSSPNVPNRIPLSTERPIRREHAVRVRFVNDGELSLSERDKHRAIGLRDSDARHVPTGARAKARRSRRAPIERFSTSFTGKLEWHLGLLHRSGAAPGSVSRTRPASFVDGSIA